MLYLVQICMDEEELIFMGFPHCTGGPVGIALAAYT